jgi:hypothetical protein
MGQQPNLLANPFFVSLIKHTPLVIDSAPSGLTSRLVVSDPKLHITSTSGSCASGATATDRFMWTNLIGSWLMFFVKEWGNHALANIIVPTSGVNTI